MASLLGNELSTLHHETARSVPKSRLVLALWNKQTDPAALFFFHVYYLFYVIRYSAGNRKLSSLMAQLKMSVAYLMLSCQPEDLMKLAVVMHDIAWCL